MKAKSKHLYNQEESKKLITECANNINKRAKMMLEEHVNNIKPDFGIKYIRDQAKQIKQQLNKL